MFLRCDNVTLNCVSLFVHMRYLIIIDAFPYVLGTFPNFKMRFLFVDVCPYPTHARQPRAPTIITFVPRGLLKIKQNL